MSTDNDRPSQPAKPAWVVAWLLLAAAVFSGLMALGVWQVQRLQWKLALIDRIEQRVHAEPVAAPTPVGWAGVSREASEYSRVQVAGRFDHSKETLVRASTELGRGFWVLTPLRTTAGFWVLVNRGFVPSADTPRAGQADIADTQMVTGLLRLSEPGGSLLQRNDAAQGRWYSRDVKAIAAGVKLDGASASPNTVLLAPYFIDAAAASGAKVWPRGGLTVVRFNNHHVVYAMTWFVLAAMLAGAVAYLLRSERQWRVAAAVARLAVAHA
jgi:surfeit locus 1 family protein